MGRIVAILAVVALKWWRKAADQGLAISQYNLGCMYQNGQGVPKNDAGAVKWWHKAAEQGHARAQLRLGIMYYYGQGVPKNDAEAVKLWHKAAEQGLEEAKPWLEKLEAK